MINPVDGQVEVLLVDEEKGLLEQAKLFLERQDDRLIVTTATSAEEGLEVLENDDFDVVVSDYKMPGMDGLEFLRTLREQDKEIPFIIFTGTGREEVAMDALNLGADYYFKKGGDPESQFGVLSNVIIRLAERRRAKEAFARERRLFQALLKNIPDMIFFKDEEGRFLRVSEAEAKHLGADPEDVVGKTDFDFYPEEEAEKFLRDDQEVMEKGPMVNRVDKISGPEGEKIWVSGSKVPFYDEDGNVRGVLGITRDINERKEAEEKLKRSEQRFRTFFEANPDPVFLLNEDGVLQNVNKAFCRRSGFEREELVGKHFEELEFLSEESRERLKESFRRRARGEDVQPYTISGETEDAETFFAEVNGALLEEGDEVIGVLGVARDITERRRMEEELRESEERFRSFFENLGDGIFVESVEGGDFGRILEVNPAAVEQTGYSREELIGMNIVDDLVVPESSEMDQDEIVERISEGETVSFTQRKRRKDGSEYWAEVVITPIEHEGRKAALSVNRDITEKVKIREKLAFESNLLRSLLDHVPDSVCFKDSQNQFVRVSKSKAEHLGVDREEIRGKTDFDFYPEDQAEEMAEDDRRVMETGEPVIGEERVERPDGEEKWVSVVKVPRYDREGNVIGTVGISRDITERKRMEEREEFLHSLLRHDLRNKAQISRGYLELLQDTDLNDEQRDLVEKALKGAEDGIRLIERVRTLEEVEMGETVRETNVLSKLKRVFKDFERLAEDKDISIEIEGSEIQVMGGRLLEELFSNLVENSIRHAGCDKINISVREEGGECVVSVEDDGSGIPSDVREEVFEEGFKLGESAGSGLGLSLARVIVDLYDGNIEAKDSELGGARFDVHLKKA